MYFSFRLLDIAIQRNCVSNAFLSMVYKKKAQQPYKKTQTKKTIFWQLLKGDRQQDRPNHKDLMGLSRTGREVPQPSDVEVFASCSFSPCAYLEQAAQQSSHALIQ